MARTPSSHTIIEIKFLALFLIKLGLNNIVKERSPDVSCEAAL